MYLGIKVGRVSFDLMHLFENLFKDIVNLGQIKNKIYSILELRLC